MTLRDAHIADAAAAAARARWRRRPPDAAWTVKGHGFGHGVGLSQYGAYGYAKHGRDYQPDPQPLLRAHEARPRSGQRPRPARLRAKGRSASAAPGAPAASGSTRAATTASRSSPGASSCAARRATGRRLRRRGQGGQRGEDRRHRPLPRQPRRPGDRRQHAGHQPGRLRGLRQGRGAERGVVLVAVAALEAQAVVARSYGLATEPGRALRPVRGHPQPGLRRPGIGDQARPTSAVAATAKRVVTYQGEPAITYYFSTSGGQTENSEFGFSGGNPVPYLKSVDDPFDDASPVHNWTERLSDDEIESKLSGLFEGRLKRIDVTQTGRVTADRPRPGGRHLRVERGHRRHPARAARSDVDVGPLPAPLTRRRAANLRAWLRHATRSAPRARRRRRRS